MVIDPGNSINNALGKGTSATSDSGRTRQNAAVSSRDKTESRPAKATPGDNVSLSDAGQSLAKMEAQLSSMPDVDEARVAEIRAELANGSYTIDADAIAEKMLNHDNML